MRKFKIQNSKFKSSIKNLKFLILNCSFTFYILHFTFPCYAQPLSSTDLINNAAQYDGRAVAYEGEVIGDIMRRGNYAWINVNDGENAIGIWIDASLAKEIIYSGSHKYKGDWVEVVGIFNRACAEHGGDLDIHAQSLRKTASGRLVKERLNLGKRNLTIVLFGILSFIWILTLLKRR